MKNFMPKVLTLSLASLMCNPWESFSKGLDELSESVPKPSGATDTSDSAPAQKSPAGPTNPAGTVPSVTPTTPAPAAAVKPDVGTDSGEDEDASDDKDPSTEQAVAQVIERSATSKKLENRLLIGTTTGWNKVNSKLGEWSGAGFTSANFKWKLGETPESRVFCRDVTLRCWDSKVRKSLLQHNVAWGFCWPRNDHTHVRR